MSACQRQDYQSMELITELTVRFTVCRLLEVAFPQKSFSATCWTLNISQNSILPAIPFHDSWIQKHGFIKVHLYRCCPRKSSLSRKSKFIFFRFSWLMIMSIFWSNFKAHFTDNCHAQNLCFFVRVNLKSIWIIWGCHNFRSEHTVICICSSFSILR